LEFINNLNIYPIPEIVLLDVAMPEMDGYETAKWLKENHPDIKILIISMMDDEETILKMIRIKVNGYILKDLDANDLKTALDSTMQSGFYYSGQVNEIVTKNITDEKSTKNHIDLSEREKEFMKLSCTQLSYDEISLKMKVSYRTIDGYRESVFNKLKLKCRVGIVLYSIKNKLVKI